MAELMAEWVWALSRTWSCPAPALGCGSFMGLCLAPGFEQFPAPLPTTSVAAGGDFVVPGWSCFQGRKKRFLKASISGMP